MRKKRHSPLYPQIYNPPGKIIHGEILFEEMDLLRVSDSEMREIRGNKISMIFQEPMTSLNPVFTIGDQISEAIILHQGFDRKEAWEKSVEMLKLVQIPEPEARAYEHPHKLSGGMRQRAMIAMALSCHPELLIADEPTTALDVTIQAQILDPMLKLKEDMGTSIILITHNLVPSPRGRRVIVMYTGKVVEEPLLKICLKNLFIPIPRPAPIDSWIGTKMETGETASGDPGIVPSILVLPGCSFFPRCRRQAPL
jgi:ABC-type dipeptide/oligopeptide/nickel transport system ATPase component